MPRDGSSRITTGRITRYVKRLKIIQFRRNPLLRTFPVDRRRIQGLAPSSHNTPIQRFGIHIILRQNSSVLVFAPRPPLKSTDSRLAANHTHCRQNLWQGDTQPFRNLLQRPAPEPPMHNLKLTWRQHEPKPLDIDSKGNVLAVPTRPIDKDVKKLVKLRALLLRHERERHVAKTCISYPDAVHASEYSFTTRIVPNSSPEIVPHFVPHQPVKIGEKRCKRPSASTIAIKQKNPRFVADSFIYRGGL